MFVLWVTGSFVDMYNTDYAESDRRIRERRRLTESAISDLPLLPLSAHGIIPAMKQEVKFQAAAATSAAQALGLLYDKSPATA